MAKALDQCPTRSLDQIPTCKISIISQYNFTPNGQPGTCSDGTATPKTHGINKDGDAIANYEYCTRLCKGKQTHCLFVLDWFSLHLGQLNQSHINKESNWWEMKLDCHDWARFNAVNTGIGELCQYFRKQSEIQDQHVFMFPYHLNEGQFNPTAWRSVAVPEQVVIDVRTQASKDFTKMCEPTRTLKNAFEVWEDRPQLICAETQDSAGIFNQMVDYLKEASQIVQICKGSGNNAVDFIFHNDKPPFAQV